MGRHGTAEIQAFSFSGWHKPRINKALATPGGGSQSLWMMTRVPDLTPTPHLDSLDTGIVASGMHFIGHVAVQALLCEDWGLGPRH